MGSVNFIPVALTGEADRRAGVFRLGKVARHEAGERQPASSYGKEAAGLQGRWTPVHKPGARLAATALPCDPGDIASLPEPQFLFWVN